MAKALKPLVIVLLVLSIIALSLGMALFSRREVLKGRTQKGEQAIVKIAQNLRVENFDAAQFTEQIKNYEGMQAPLDGIAVFAENRYEELQNTKKDLETTRQDLAKTKSELETTKVELADTQAKVTELTDTVAQKDAELAQASGRITQLEQDKANLQGQIDELNNQLVKSEEDMRDLQDQVATLDKIIKDMEIEKGGPVLGVPSGLSGKIVIVNPDWNFVILDIGSDQKLVPGAEMMVHRADRLIGKVRVSSVHKNLAVAEIMADWRQADPNEGDNVLF
jgi:predicted RNase H-like nuclease (RuvC/YqgF family)